MRDKQELRVELATIGHVKNINSTKVNARIVQIHHKNTEIILIKEKNIYLAESYRNTHNKS